LTTKVHALVDALGNPCNLMLTPAQDHDLTCAQPLLENADPRASPGDHAHMTKVPVQPHGRVNGPGFAVEEADAAHVHGPIVGGGHDRTLIES
jgi:hypothetical protein